MKKTLLVIPVIVLLASLVLAVTAFAGCCEDPCEPCEPCHYCSPGFWKNHTELWQDDFAADYDWMIAGLTAKGWQENFGDRWVATDMLNAAYPDAPCD
jgi:hypothetical protein